MSINNDLIKLVREMSVAALAESIVDVQPMDGEYIKDLHDISESQADLKAQGFAPVSNIGLLWTNVK